jgi:hypothetical protein
VKKREVSNRRAGYDFTFSAPKSVSLYLAVNEDKVVEQMITEAVDETMAAIEARMETKVRKGYQHDNRFSSNITYAKFIHRETRPVDGIEFKPVDRLPVHELSAVNGHSLRFKYSATSDAQGDLDHSREIGDIPLPHENIEPVHQRAVHLQRRDAGSLVAREFHSADPKQYDHETIT